MDPTSTAYCQTCALDLLGTWKGWPHKQPIPVLPRLDSGCCSVCGGKSPLDSVRINWFNYHSPNSTGLPEHWFLRTDDEALRRHWGLPYYSEANCPKCRVRATVSQMLFPNGRHELRINCQQCGVSPIDP